MVRGLALMATILGAGYALNSNMCRGRQMPFVADYGNNSLAPPPSPKFASSQAYPDESNRGQFEMRGGGYVIRPDKAPELRIDGLSVPQIFAGMENDLALLAQINNDCGDEGWDLKGIRRTCENINARIDSFMATCLMANQSGANRDCEAEFGPFEKVEDSLFDQCIVRMEMAGDALKKCEETSFSSLGMDQNDLRRVKERLEVGKRVCEKIVNDGFDRWKDEFSGDPDLLVDEVGLFTHANAILEQLDPDTYTDDQYFDDVYALMKRLLEHLGSVERPSQKVSTAIFRLKQIVVE